MSLSGPAGRPGVLSDGTLNLSFGFNTEGRLNERSHTIGQSEIYSVTLAHDAAGRVIEKVESAGGIEHTYHYLYDLDGQLLEVHLDGLLSERYQYDDNGNRTLRELEGVGETATYDAQDRLQSQGSINYTFDDDGFLSQRGALTFEYTARGELLKATIGPADDVVYTYDGLGRRVARVDNGGKTEYLYGNPLNILLVTEVRSPDATLTEYFYDESGKLVAMDRDGTRYYIATDPVGSPRVIFDVNGAVVKRIAYDSWGMVTEDTDPNFSMPFGFAGGLNDESTGLVHFGYRDYDPLVGRWTARDPVLYQGGQANLYVYVENDPINFRDPTGLFCVGASAFDGFGGGIKACMKGGDWSFCGEVGIGFGGGAELDFNGGVASATDSLYASASVGAGCGPFSVGLGAKLNSCANLSGSCGGGITGKGALGDILGKNIKGLSYDPCAGKGKFAIDPTFGKVNGFQDLSKEYLVNGKTKCKLGAKAVVGACFSTK